MAVGVDTVADLLQSMYSTLWRHASLALYWHCPAFSCDVIRRSILNAFARSDDVTAGYSIDVTLSSHTSHTCVSPPKARYPVGLHRLRKHPHRGNEITNAAARWRQVTGDRAVLTVRPQSTRLSSAVAATQSQTALGFRLPKQHDGRRAMWFASTAGCHSAAPVGCHALGGRQDTLGAVLLAIGRS